MVLILSHLSPFSVRGDELDRMLRTQLPAWWLGWAGQAVEH